MSFLDGAFLAGILAAAVPIVIHLLSRRKAPPVSFPSLRFLEEVERHTARRSRLTEWLILILRVAALLLLALALARPVLHSGALGRGRAARVIIVDNSMSSSASLEGVSALERYRSIAKMLLQRMKPADRAAVLPLHAAPGYAPALTESRGALERALEGIGPTYRSSPLVDALRRAAELLEGDDNPVREIYLLSDLQASAFRDAGVAPEIPESARLMALRPRQAAGLNAWFARVEARGARLPVITGDLRGAGAGEAVVRVALTIDGGLVEERAVRVRSGMDAGVRFQAPVLEAGFHRGELRIRDDSLAADDSFHFGFSTGERLSALIVRDAEVTAGSMDPAFYLSRALAPRGRRHEPLRVRAAATRELGGLDLAPFDAVFLVEPRDLDERARKALSEFVLAGGGLFVSSGPLQDEDSLRAFDRAAIWPVALGPVVGARRAPVHLSTWEREHPIWAPLLDATPPLRPDVPLFLAYRKVRVLDGAQVIAGFESGDPAMVARRAGLGKVVFFASTLSGEWTNLPLRFLFAPLARSVLAYLAASSEGEEQHPVGSPLLLRYPRGLGFVESLVEWESGERRRLKAPDIGSPAGVAIAPGAPGGAALDAGADLAFDLGAPEKPDLLVITERYRHRERRRLIAVRPDPLESDLRPLESSELDARLPGARVIEFATEADALRGAARLTTGSELQNSLLILLMVFLLVEPLLANRAAWRRPRDGGVSHGGRP